MNLPELTENGFIKNQEKLLLQESEETLEAYNQGKIKGYKDIKELFLALEVDEI